MNNLKFSCEGFLQKENLYQMPSGLTKQFALYIYSKLRVQAI